MQDLGALFNLLELVARGKTQYHCAGAGIDECLEAVEDLVPGSCKAKRAALTIASIVRL